MECASQNHAFRYRTQEQYETIEIWRDVLAHVSQVAPQRRYRHFPRYHYYRMPFSWHGHTVGLCLLRIS